jgi:aspartate/tyrosine/aromatic aminotransferase
LVDVLKEAVPGHNFDYLLKQRGMFSYTGLSAGLAASNSRWASQIVPKTSVV